MKLEMKSKKFKFRISFFKLARGVIAKKGYRVSFSIMMARGRFSRAAVILGRRWMAAPV